MRLNALTLSFGLEKTNIFKGMLAKILKRATLVDGRNLISFVEQLLMYGGFVERGCSQSQFWNSEKDKNKILLLPSLKK